MEVNETDIVVLGELVEKADNLVAASRLPLPPQMHVEQLRSGLESIRDELRRIYVAAMGEDPWKD